MTVRFGLFMNGGDWDDIPACEGCGAMAGCCNQYPNCPGNPEWKADKIAPIIEISPDGHDKESNQT